MVTTPMTGKYGGFRNYFPRPAPVASFRGATLFTPVYSSLTPSSSNFRPQTYSRTLNSVFATSGVLVNIKV